LLTLILLCCAVLSAGAAAAVQAAPAADLPLAVVVPLTLDPPDPSAGELVTATFTLRNEGAAAVTLLRVGAGGRGPGCGDFVCDNYQDFPLAAAVTIGAGQTYRYEAARTLAAAGPYFFQVTYEAPAGNWHFLDARLDVTVGRGLELLRALTLTPAAPTTAAPTTVAPTTVDLVTAEFELVNAGTKTLSFQKIGVGVRGPACTLGDWGCTELLDFPFAENVTLGPGERLPFRSWRLFPAAGSHFAQISVLDAAGTWGMLGSRRDLTVTPGTYTQRMTPLRFGVQWHPTRAAATNDAELALAAQVGAQVIRIGPSWRLLEPHGKGQWDEGYLAELDHIVDTARALDIEPYLMLLQVPCWASTDPRKNCTQERWDDAYPPSNFGDYAAALRKLAAHFGDRVTVWEVWNEPNVARFWKPAPDASAYTRLLQTTYAAIKAQQPHAVVLGGSLAGADYRFLDAMYAAGAQGAFDALALHPYSAGAPGLCTEVQWSFACGIDGIRSQMLQKGDGKPLWLTEFGWSTYGSLTEAMQRDYLIGALAELQKRPYVAAVSWYTLVNTDFQDLPPELAKDNDFGLFYRDYRPKLAAQWLAAERQRAQLYLPALRK
jgi:hypothetical protein